MLSRPMYCVHSPLTETGSKQQIEMAPLLAGPFLLVTEPEQWFRV